MEDYRTIRGTAIGEYEEKKSRFIAQLSFADSEEKAVAFLEQVRAANRTARHNVYAYRLREGTDGYRFPPPRGGGEPGALLRRRRTGQNSGYACPGGLAA